MYININIIISKICLRFCFENAVFKFKFVKKSRNKRRKYIQQKKIAIKLEKKNIAHQNTNELKR